MKIVHKKEDTTTWMELAATYEADGDIDQAIDAYERALRLNPRKESAYQRLMILFRKKKDIDRELKVIDQAIKAFDQVHSERTKSASKKIKRLSHSLAALTGLSDKKGRTIDPGQPVSGWLKRKILLGKRRK